MDLRNTEQFVTIRISAVGVVEIQSSRVIDCS
ncbi:hypothetical protein RRG08_022245 [Elysia crispata]|uniref:Uncharacterized protein n=1 Tax=Elysia crispata TaxID=231223 RepID=A0AAE1DL88_9GAST|nr:hypothetical protein RRG08_022245 [Elysia crispata]